MNKALLLAGAVVLTLLATAAAPLKPELAIPVEKARKAKTCAELIDAATDVFNTPVFRKLIVAGVTTRQLVSMDFTSWKRHPGSGHSILDWSVCRDAPEAETLRLTTAEKVETARLMAPPTTMTTSTTS